MNRFSDLDRLEEFVRIINFNIALQRVRPFFKPKVVMRFRICANLHECEYISYATKPKVSIAIGSLSKEVYLCALARIAGCGLIVFAIRYSATSADGTSSRLNRYIRNSTAILEYRHCCHNKYHSRYDIL